MKKIIVSFFLFLTFSKLQSTVDRLDRLDRREVQVEYYTEGASKRIDVWNTEICGRYQVVRSDKEGFLSFYSNGIYKGDFSFLRLKKYLEKHPFLNRKEKKIFTKSLEKHFSN